MGMGAASGVDARPGSAGPMPRVSPPTSPGCPSAAEQHGAVASQAVPLPAPRSLPALEVGHANLAPTHPASGSRASPVPTAGGGPPPSPPVVAADQGPALFTIGSGGAAAGAKPVASTGKGSQAAGASSDGL
ncbi:formin-like protein 16 [Cyanistes caeruleus]|uniref:formin-like protein 16 n=1 Tax=Cyanistes caeruleus TaxID=156563 RepID=UPI000CDB0C4B|nr:formin-like protein 16 [Cyanistes caeruleus]